MKAVIQWVLRTMMKDQTGVTRTLPKKDLVDFNVAMTAERLMRNGVDPNSLKNANQVENAINMIESRPPVQQGITSTKSAKVFDMEGQEIPKGSKIMGGKAIKEKEAEIAERLGKENKQAAQRMRNKKLIEDAIDNASPGFAGDIKYDAQLVADDLAERKGKMFDELSQEEQIDLYDQAYKGLSKQRFKGMKRPASEDRALEDFVDDAGGVNPDDPRGIDDFIPDDDPEPLAQGGRAGFKEGSGMTRRSFLKILGGLASIPIVGKFLKPIKTAKGIKSVPIIKTVPVEGKPEWFDALVNKVIVQGDDMTKQFATKDREIVHATKIDEDTFVRVTQDLDEGSVRVEYENPDNVFGDPVQMEYKKPLPDEGAPNPAAEFSTAESGPVGRQVGPDDYDLEVEEIGGTSIRDLDSDVSKLKEYATGKGPTIREIIQNKKRKDKARRITDDIDGAASDAAIRRQGEYYPDEDGLASGGIARMLGE